MYPLVIAFLGAMLITWQLAITQPQQIATWNNVAGDVAAANFWAYRGSTVSYLNANPGATGTVADASLTFPMGYIRNPAWTNVIQGGTLYTYSTSALSPSTVDAIARRGSRTMLIGIAQSGGTMNSLTGAASGLTIPAAIAAGSVVVIGN